MARPGKAPLQIVPPAEETEWNWSEEEPPGSFAIFEEHVAATRQRRTPTRWRINWWHAAPVLFCLGFWAVMFWWIFR